jgi:hypothetical protein
MRRFTASAVALIMALSAASPVPGFAQTGAGPAAQSAAAIDPVIEATIKAFPDGGQRLSDRIMMLVLQDNDRAVDVAKYLTSREIMSAPQRAAVEKGLGQALARLGIYAQAPDGIDPGVLFALLMLGIGGAAVGIAASHKSNNNSPLLPLVSPH